MLPTANVPATLRHAFSALSFLCALFVFSSPVRAQLAGAVDPGFVATTGGIGSPVVNRVVVQPDGKFYVVGSYQVAGGSPRRGLARFNADGTLDSGFNANLNGFARSIAVDGTGKIVVTGTFTAVNSVTRNQIARLNADGSLDTSFAGGAGLFDGFTTVGAEAVVIDAAGGVILGGTFKQVHGVTRNGIARLNPDGSLDTAFNPGTDSNGRVFAIRSDANGRLLVGGLFAQIGGLTTNSFARLNADGSGDATFNSGTGSLGPVRDIEFDGNGKILICGMFSQYNSAPQARIARLNADGSLDGTFAPLVTASSTTPDLNDLAVDSQGRILIGGTFNAVNAVSRSFLARLNSDGSLDTGFDIGSTLTFDPVRSIAVIPGDRLIVGGMFITFGTSQGDIRRLNADGTVDATFPARITVNSQASIVLPDGTGRLLVAGNFREINGVSRTGIARLNADGSVDQTFNPGTGTGAINAMILDANGRILIAGGFGAYNGTVRTGLARINSDGSLDAGFNPVIGVTATVNAVAVEGNGQILIGGNFSTVNGENRSRLARLNADGSLDTSFNTGTGPDNRVLAIGFDSAGRVLIGGQFTNVSGVSTGRLARLTTTGTADTDFLANFTSGQVNVLRLLPSGQVLIGGVNLRFGTNPIAFIFRLNADGSLDGSFSGQVGGSSTDGIRSIAIDSLGRIVVGGDFTGTSIPSRKFFTRLLSNGMKDANLDAATGPDLEVNGVAVDSTDRMLVAGKFSTFNSATRFGLVRLFGDTNCSSSVSPTTPIFPASGGTTTLTVTTPTGCPWTVAGTLPDWLSVNATGGSGNGTVQLTATANPTTSLRSASFTVAGQTVSVTQDASVTVNSSVGLVTTSAVIVPTICGAQGYANDYLVTAVATNTGTTTLYNLGFEVVELREANGAAPAVPFRLVSADGATCGSGGLAGSRQTVAAQIAPGGSVTFQFRIALPSIRRFRFLVTAVAATVAPLTNRPPRSTGVQPPLRGKAVDTPRYFRR